MLYVTVTQLHNISIMTVSFLLYPHPEQSKTPEEEGKASIKIFSTTQLSMFKVFLLGSNEPQVSMVMLIFTL